jgi:mevalonate pyrophosphate decarboxylase
MRNFLDEVTYNFREKLNVDIRNTTDLPTATGKSSSRGIAATDPGM